MFETNPYICHRLVGHCSYLASSELELLVGCDDDEQNAPLKWNRRSHPVTPPSGVSYAFCLQH
jgi:hypothetical protein